MNTRIELVSSNFLTQVLTEPKKYELRKFLTDNGDIYTACDNFSGDAWTEDFANIVDAIAWLDGGGTREDYIGNYHIMRSEKEDG